MMAVRKALSVSCQRFAFQYAKATLKCAAGSLESACMRRSSSSSFIGSRNCARAVPAPMPSPRTITTTTNRYIAPPSSHAGLWRQRRQPLLRVGKLVFVPGSRRDGDETTQRLAGLGGLGQLVLHDAEVVQRARVARIGIGRLPQRGGGCGGLTRFVENDAQFPDGGGVIRIRLDGAPRFRDALAPRLVQHGEDVAIVVRLEGEGEQRVGSLRLQ